MPDSINAVCMNSSKSHGIIEGRSGARVRPSVGVSLGPEKGPGLGKSSKLGDSPGIRDARCLVTDLS